MDSMGKISKDLRAWARNSGMTVPNEYADRIDALIKEPVAEIISHNTAVNVWWYTIPDEIPIGTKLFAAPPAPASEKYKSTIADLCDCFEDVMNGKGGWALEEVIQEARNFIETAQ